MCHHTQFCTIFLVGCDDTIAVSLIFKSSKRGDFLSLLNQEIDSFIEADYDVTTIIEQLKGIVYKLNFVHECYIAKLIGFNNFKSLVDEFPAKEDSTPIQKRINTHIEANF